VTFWDKVVFLNGTDEKMELQGPEIERSTSVYGYPSKLFDKNMVYGYPSKLFDKNMENDSPK
jgi:hypothetical protein